MKATIWPTSRGLRERVIPCSHAGTTLSGTESAGGQERCGGDLAGSHRVTDGVVTDNWHLEDNLTLMHQLGVVAP